MPQRKRGNKAVLCFEDEEPEDWQRFVAYYKEHGDFVPRNFAWDKAPQWLFREYHKWREKP